MADEFKHLSAGTTLTQGEYEAVGGHVFACQETGDIVYASSGSQLSRLGKGAANTILAMGGSCVPAWTAAPAPTTIELGHASDTTLARSSSGDVSIECNVIYRAGGTDVALADGGTGASLSDPGADRLLFWDDGSCAVAFLPAGSGLTICGTTMTASGGAVSAVSNGSDDRIATFSSSTALYGETNLTFDNTTFSFSRSHSSALEAIFANTGTSSGDSMYVDIRNAGGGGEAGIVINGESTNYYYMGLSDGNPVMSIGAHSSRAFSNDTMRFSDAAPPVITYNTTHPTGTFDYVCESCGKHSHEKFECCGKVEWHDDVLAMREAAIAVNTMANPYEPGQNVSIDQMVMLGIMEYDTPIKPGRPERGAWLGLAPVAGTWFTWAGMYQNRERMDNYHAEHEAQIARLTARVEELENHG